VQPIRRVTHGPYFHWFGYYDKQQFDPSNRYLLANEVEFEHRTPGPQDKLRVGMVDLTDGDRWIPFGESKAWGWQQGCMLQWRPGSNSEVVWNDREGDGFVARILDVETGARRTLSRPIYTLSPDGRFGLSADFARIQRMRPGYGYVGLEDPHHEERAPEDAGVWRIDLDSGEVRLVLSLAHVAGLPHEGRSLEDCWHYFNHLLVSPDGLRFIVLHRWRRRLWYPKPVLSLVGFVTRMLTLGVDGSDLFVLDPSGRTSHFIWRDAEHVCAWTKPRGRESGFYLFRDRTREVEQVGEGVMTENGHITYLDLAGQQWILNDTYPGLLNREQTPYLYHVPSRRRWDLGYFSLPMRYQGEYRCDLHPRSSNDARLVAIDSPHEGLGRQIYLIDVADVLKAPLRG
jgi:hypothetical protein